MRDERDEFWESFFDVCDESGAARAGEEALLHQLLGLICQLAIFFQYAVIHLGIADNIQLPEPVQLDFSGCHHPLANDGGFSARTSEVIS